MQRKLVVLFCLVLLAFAGLSVRLILINRDNGDSYKKQVLSQQQYSSTTIPYKRGEILDNKGTKLASSEKVYDLVLDIKQMNNKEDYVEPTIQALEDYFSIDGDQVRAYAQEHPDSQYYVLKKRMSYNEISDYQQMMADTSQKEYNQYVKGIWFEESYKRVYPNSSLASDVIGFTRTDGTGTYGLEEYYNDVLSGVNGRQYGYIDGDDNLQRTTEAAVDGYNVYSTIDATIQGIVEKYLKKYNDENKDSTREGNGAQDAACIVMDVHSGEVLAMASYPTFDLNDTRNPEALIGSKLIDVSGNSTDTVIACSPSQTSRPFQKTVSLLYPVRTPHIPASCNASYHIRRSSDVNSAVPVPISSYFPLISAHAFCACRVCVKCAQTQISRLKNFIFQSSASVSTDIFA